MTYTRQDVRVMLAARERAVQARDRARVERIDARLEKIVSQLKENTQ